MSVQIPESSHHHLSYKGSLSHFFFSSNFFEEPRYKAATAEKAHYQIEEEKKSSSFVNSLGYNNETVLTHHPKHPCEMQKKNKKQQKTPKLFFETEMVKLSSRNLAENQIKPSTPIPHRTSIEGKVKVS